jgi:carboxylesterase
MRNLIRSQYPVRRCALPIIKRHETLPPAAVLGIHGFGGYPGELALPARHLHEAGFDVLVPRLPGHGTSQRDFDGTDRFDWVGAACDWLADALKQYKQVHLLGHSMGGAIACLLAASFSVGRTVLMAPALDFSSRWFDFVGPLSWVRPKIKVEWQPDESFTFFDDRDDDDDAFLGREYWSTLNMRKIAQLKKISGQARKALPNINTDILVLTGGKDPTVPVHVAQLVSRRSPGRVVCEHMREGGHLLPYDPDDQTRQKVMELTVQFLVDAGRRQ